MKLFVPVERAIAVLHNHFEEKTMGVDFIMAYENGELNESEIVEGFQDGINSGLVWKLQGHYGRMAARLIEQGYCHDTNGYLVGRE
jgi:hypothetical protein